MPIGTVTLRMLALVVGLLLSVSAHALVFRAYLAPTGADTNPCTLPLPCRLLPAALAAVQDGGEIWLLDSANYNTATVNVTKSVTILAVPGAVGSVVATAGPALTVATASVKVTLRNLVIVPLPGTAGTNGITMTAGSSLTVEGCLIADHAGRGIHAVGTVTVRVNHSTLRGNGAGGLEADDGATVSVHRSIVQGNTGAGILALATNSLGVTRVAVSDTLVDGNSTYGVRGEAPPVSGSIRLSVKDSRITHNGSYGYSLYTINLGSLEGDLSGSLVAANTTGVHTTGIGSSLFLNGNTITNNTASGIIAGANPIRTMGNNAVFNNTGAETSGTITSTAGT